MSYLTSQTLQYGVTHAQESADSLPHVPWRKYAKSPPQDYGFCVSRGFPGGIDTGFTRHKIVRRAALKRRHVSFSGPVNGACCAMHAHTVRNIQVIVMTNSAAPHLLPVFARSDLGFERGEGCWLIATNGDRYLDFTSGVAVNALGHAHPALVKALQEQATKLWHMSNLFQSPDGEKLAARLCNESFADFVFFCNSGAEALEGVIKLVRHHHFSKGHPERYRIITFEGAFHGRTLATLAATGSAKYLEGGLARRWTASTRSRMAISKPSRRRSVRRPPAS
ncbi:hypothetical protein ACVW0J_001742 [Bradyrhizobium sp. i1.7.7]